MHAQLEEAKNLFAVRRGVLVPPPRRAPAEAQPARKPPPGTPQKAMPRGGEHGPAEAVLSPGAAQSPPLKKQRAGDEGLESHGDGGGDRPRVHSSGAQVLVTKDGRLHMMPKPKLRAEERGSTEVGVAKTPGVTEQMGPTATVQPQQMGATPLQTAVPEQQVGPQQIDGGSAGAEEACSAASTDGAEATSAA